jgi:mannose-6-phosphate isomerase
MPKDERIMPYPLLFEPILKEKVWGGRRLERLGKVLPQDPSVLVGESWELADLASTSPTGGGGDPAHSHITNGPLTGKTIGHALEQWKDDLLGEAIFERECRTQGTDTPAFPLLLKYLDASEHLSVQVHPSPEYAAAHDDAHLKTESWYILDAEPMGDEPPLIFKGLAPGVTEEDLRQRIADGTLPEVLLSEPAIPGQCHTLESGTVHALGAGVLVAEVQTPSDTTFRLYDWTKEYDRPPRALHVDQAVACIDFDAGPAPEPMAAPDGAVLSRVAATDFYSIDDARPDENGLTVPPDSCALIMTIAGSGWIVCDGLEDTPISVGVTAAIPAAIAATTRIVADEHLRVLLVALV